MRAFWSALVAVVLASGLAACSDRVSGSALEPPAATVSAGGDEQIGGYAGSFDEVTAGFRQRSEELQARAGDLAGDPSRVIGFYEELRVIAADARQQYGGLVAPDEVRSVHQTILQLFDRQVVLLDQVVQSAGAGDDAALAEAVQGLVDLTEEFDRARRQMESAILACGRPCLT